MVEYIEKEAAQKIICGWCGVCKSPTVCDLMHCDDICPQFAQIPAADVRPVVRAYWKSVPYKRARVCSRCEADEPYKFADDDANVYNFCPNCGCVMGGTE